MNFTIDIANLLGRSIGRYETMTAKVVDSSARYFAHPEVRESQSDMITDGIEALLCEGTLLASAPTGIGKTAASLASAINVQRSSSDNLKILLSLIHI